MLLIFVIGAIMISQLTCGDQSSKIIGKWRFFYSDVHISLNDNTILEFYQDKTFVISFSPGELYGNRTWTGNWMMLDDGKIKMTYTNPYGEVEVVKIDKNYVDKIIIKIKKDIPLHFIRPVNTWNVGWAD